LRQVCAAGCVLPARLPRRRELTRHCYVSTM
jgi:hypothetical protein